MNIDGTGKTGENETRQVRGETGTDWGLCIEGSEGRAIQPCERTGNLLQRTDGEARTQGGITLVTGGIVAQLVRQAERRLGNVEACITWYEQEKQDAQQELEELKQLLSLLKNQETGDVSTDE